MVRPKSEEKLLLATSRRGNAELLGLVCLRGIQRVVQSSSVVDCRSRSHKQGLQNLDRITYSRVPYPCASLPPLKHPRNKSLLHPLRPETLQQNCLSDLKVEGDLPTRTGTLSIPDRVHLSRGNYSQQDYASAKEGPGWFVSWCQTHSVPQC